MDLRGLPEWSAPFLAGSIVLAGIALLAWFFGRLRKRRGEGEVLGSPICFGTGVMCLLVVGGVVWLGLFLTRPGVLERDFLAWIALIAAFGLSGIGLIVSQLGVLARFDEIGVCFRRFHGRWELVRWHEFHGVRPGFVLWNGPVFKIRGRRSMLISSDYLGVVELLLAARKAGIPGARDFFANDDVSEG